MNKGFWTAPPNQPGFYEAIRWLERVMESDHPSSPYASTLHDVLKTVFYQDKKERDLLIDSALGHKDLITHSLIAFKTQDLADLHLVTHNMKGIKNHAVAIRRLISQEAKRIREGA